MKKPKEETFLTWTIEFLNTKTGRLLYPKGAMYSIYKGSRFFTYIVQRWYGKVNLLKAVGSQEDIEVTYENN